MNKPYWIRYIPSDQSAKSYDSIQFKTIKEAKKFAYDSDKSGVSFYYVMTIDPWSECFVECHNVERAS